MLKGRGNNVILTAFTGIASSLLHRGTTLHSRFKIPVPTHEDSESYLNEKADINIIRNTALIIVDEASMIPKAVLHSLDRLLRNIMYLPDVPFGGKCLLLCGDFRQCAPVSDIPQITDSTTESIKYSFLWVYFVRYNFISNQRADANEEFFKNWSLRIGDGEEPTLNNTSLIQLPSEVVCENNIVFDIFGENIISIKDIDRYSMHVILTPNNQDSLEINDVILKRIEGRRITYRSITKIEYDDPLDEEMYPIEHAFAETPNGYPPHKLKVKIGAIVILLRNWCVRDGLCNGTRLKVIQCNKHSIKCAILTGENAQKEYTFSRCVFRPKDNDTNPIKIIRTQFPFRLAFAMTINKSQGQTFDKVGLLLKEPVFSHGQLYVAISRVRNLSSLKIMVVDIEGGTKQQGEIEGYTGVYTKNVVEKSLL